jgi:hypothetical protein
VGKKRIQQLEIEIFYKDWPITLEVEYEYHIGTTSGMGYDPDHIELISAIDGTNSDVLEKLPKDTIDYIECLCYEMLDTFKF